MPGLADALLLLDHGELPIVGTQSPLPSSQQMASVTPPSTAPAAVPRSSQPVQSEVSPSSQPSALYRFDFGIHAGKTIAEAPPDYIEFLRDRGTVDGRPALAAAVAEHERDHPPLPSRSQTPSNPSQFRLNFGKHKGKLLREVPDDYLGWLHTSNLFDENAALRAALVHHDGVVAAQAKTTKKDKKSTAKWERRSDEDDMLIWGRSSYGQKRYGRSRI
jgi:uncharacterized protein (DUF3820 family)